MRRLRPLLLLVVMGHGVATQPVVSAVDRSDRMAASGDALPTLSINNVSVTEGNSGTRNATFTVSLSESSSSPVTVDYNSADLTAGKGSLSNPQNISIPSSGIASRYPSQITLLGGLGTVTKASVQIEGFTHTRGANQQYVHVAGQGDDTFPSTAPVGPYGSTLDGFNGTDPGGRWRLFVRDDTLEDAGSLVSGWQVIMTVTAPDYLGVTGTLTIAAGSADRQRAEHGHLQRDAGPANHHGESDPHCRTPHRPGCGLRRGGAGAPGLYEYPDRRRNGDHNSRSVRVAQCGGRCALAFATSTAANRERGKRHGDAGALSAL
jgi:hypothetical protein